MPAQILDGKLVSQSLKESLAQRVALLQEKGIVPRIEVVVAAQDPASVAYVRMKRKMAEAIGMISGAWEVSAATSQTELLAKIAELNANSAVHGVLVQHPLPNHLDEDAALAALGAEKDVDGITPQSLGLLVAGQRGFRSATPLGMMKLLDHYGLDVTGKHAVVIGRSVILGKPAALMLLERNATVTIAHSKTRDLPDLVRQADVLVAAVGRPELVQCDWIKTGAIVLDAGYNKVEGRTHDVGDCDFDGCAQYASWITPVPGGVGPMTIISLLANCVQAAEATMDGKSPVHSR